MLAAKASEGEFILGLIMIGACVVAGLIASALRGTAHYDLTYKGGAPYCPRCNRQVSLRREHCRSCGYQFVTYGERSTSVPLKERREMTNIPSPIADVTVEDLFVGMAKLVAKAYHALIRSIVRLAKGATWICSLRWIDSLPEWAQPIVWGLAIPIPFLIALGIWILLRRLA